jgi:hypothetical protein
MGGGKSVYILFVTQKNCKILKPDLKNTDIGNWRNHAKWRHLHERWVEENQFTFFS